MHSTSGRVNFFCFSCYMLAECALTEAIRYLDYHPEFSTYPLPEDFNAEDSAEDSNTKDPNAEEKRRFQELLSPLLLNSALAATKNPRQVIALTNRALLFALSDADRGRRLKPVHEVIG